MSLSGGHESTIYEIARDRSWKDGAPPGALIGGSWKRCVDEYGLDPQRVDVDVLTHSELTVHRDQIGEVVDIASGEMDNLASQIAGSGYALLLTDADGVILCHRSESRLQRGFRAAGLWDGADWSEARQGTNGIGTALVERRAVTVHCSDHFATRHTALSCSAAPIHAPAGELLGVLDASSVQCEDSRASQLHTMALVRMSAQLIEKSLFLNTWRDRPVLRFHSRPELVNLVHDGMLAFDEGGRILAADAGAAIQLGFDDRAVLLGKTILEIFDLAPDALVQYTAAGAVWPVREVRRGRRYFACLHGPKAKSPQSRPVSSQPSGRPDLNTLQGDDPRMADTVRCARRVTNRGIPILIHGETGTGKEVLARAIHDASDRAGEPFVAVNCAAIPESLIESELFGYKTGAFTGARRNGMRGKIMQSSGGTLFLDEIGDMPVELQTRLLRVLEEREVVPLGSEKAESVALNLIAATHAPLPEMMADGRFREDLYYRLNGIALTLPPVRERVDKQVLLHDLLAAEQSPGDPPVRIAQPALDALLTYAWPGNVRQMRSVLRTALALCDGDCITVADLPAEIVATAPTETKVISGNTLDSAERDAVRRALDHHGWNVSATARGLSVSRNTLYRKMRKHGIAGPSQH